MGTVKRFVLFLVLASLCLSLSACGPQPAKVYRIGLIARPGNTEFYQVIRGGAQAAARQLNVEIEYYEPEKDDNYGLRSKWIDEAIADNMDAIVVADSENDKLHDALARAKKAGMAIVAVDSQTENPLFDASVATDNFAAGRELGEKLRLYLHSSLLTSVGILVTRDNPSVMAQRRNGFEQAVGDLKGVQITWVEACADSQHAYQVLKQHLERNDVHVIISLSTETTLSAALAVNLIPRNRPVLGFYGSTGEVLHLEQGTIREAVVQNPFAMGYLGVTTAVNILEGDSVARWTPTNYVVVDQDSIFEEENQRLVFPFIQKQGD